MVMGTVHEYDSTGGVKDSYDFERSRHQFRSLVQVDHHHLSCCKSRHQYDQNGVGVVLTWALLRSSGVYILSIFLLSPGSEKLWPI